MNRSFQKVAHLDLKGMQPGRELLLEWVERLAAFGYTGLLIEYEDRFPYRSPLARRGDEVWSPEFLRSLLETARRAGLTVIPLQQTLGHLEYALRWDLHAAYRMPVGFPSTLHLGSPDAKAWLKGLLVEMITAHEDSPVIHLGMVKRVPWEPMRRRTVSTRWNSFSAIWKSFAKSARRMERRR